MKLFRELLEYWTKIHFIYRLMILTIIIAVMTILALRYVLDVTELGSIADWVVGIGLIFFALVELYMNHIHREEDRLRPHIKILIQQILPKIMHLLQNTWDETAVGYLRIQNYNPKGAIKLYNPSNIGPSTNREDRYLLHKHLPDIFNKIFAYDESVQKIRIDLEQFFEQANKILYPIIIAEKENGKMTDLRIDTILTHCIGLLLSKDKYLRWEKQGAIWMQEVERVKEAGWWKQLESINHQEIERKLVAIHIMSSRLNIIIRHRYEELAAEFGIEPKMN